MRLKGGILVVAGEDTSTGRTLRRESIRNVTISWKRGERRERRTRHKTQDTRYKIQDTRYKIQDTRYKIQDTRYKIQDTINDNE